MKKAISVFIIMALILSIFTACNSNNVTGPGSSNPKPNQSSPDVPMSALSMYQLVLQNNATFFSTDANKNLNITQLNQSVSDDSSITVKATSFTIVDLDKDGTPEVVLWLNVNNNDAYGCEILHYQDGVVYGYTLWYRAFYELKVNGTFLFSDREADRGIGTIKFTPKAYLIDKATYSRSIYDSNNDLIVSYFVDHESATRAEFLETIEKQEEKANVTWYDYTDQNIEKMLSSSDDYQFTVNSDDTVTITKYTGKGGDVVIPSEIDGKKVTAIGNTFEETGAFQNCTALTSVVIQNGITEIQDNAFQSCTNLVSVTIPASVTLLRNCAFGGCPILKSVYFEGNAPEVANYVFTESLSLTFYYHKGTSGWTNPWYGRPTQTY